MFICFSGRYYQDQDEIERKEIEDYMDQLYEEDFQNGFDDETRDFNDPRFRTGRKPMMPKYCILQCPAYEQCIIKYRPCPWCGYMNWIYSRKCNKPFGCSCRI